MKPGVLAGITTVLLLAAVARADNLTAESAFEAGNYPLALQRWQSRAANGDSVAQYNAAVMLLEGPGVMRDPGVAIDLLRRAAAESNSDALFAMGFLHAQGLHVAHDDELP